MKKTSNQDIKPMANFDLSLDTENTFSIECKLKGAEKRSIAPKLVMDVDGIEYRFTGEYDSETNKIEFRMGILEDIIPAGEYKSRVEVIVDERSIIKVSDVDINATQPLTIDTDERAIDDVEIELREAIAEQEQDEEVEVRSDVEFQFDELKNAIASLEEVRLVNNIDVMPADMSVDKLDTDTGVGVGYASVFGVVDTFGTRMTPTAFNRSINSKRQIPLLFNHDPAQPIGLITRMEVDARGLKVHFRLGLDLPKAKEAMSMMKMGLNGMSIGFRIVKQNRDKRSGVTDISEVMLLEVSYVAVPSNEAAGITEVRSGSDDELLTALRNMQKLITS